MNTTLLRRRDLDVTRELIVGSIIFFHAARVFDQFGFYIKNDLQEPAATFLVILSALWGMPLMFVIAGFAIRHSLRKRTVTAFVRERFRRLFVPFVVALLVIVPPQVYCRLSVAPGYQASYAQFYSRFFDITFKAGFPEFFAASPASGLFSLAHLWFLYVLLVYTLLLLPVFICLGQPAGQRLIGRVARFFDRPWAIVLPALPIAVIEAALGTDMSGGWNQSVYLVLLVYGYLLAADVRFGQILGRHWKSALVLALGSSVGAIIALSIIVESGHADPLQAYDLPSVMLRFFKGCIGWSWLVAILGFLERAGTKRQRASAKRRMFRDSVEQYANEAVLPCYILHQTILVIIGFYVVQWHISALLKFLVISLATLTVTLLLYETVVKRTRLTRYLFGMKPLRAL